MRFRSLDALRGLAALWVALHHFYVGVTSGSPPTHKVLDFWLGLSQGPVVFFFVLSGFVLTLSWQSGNRDYLAFLTQRFCRIYIPFAVSILAAIAVSYGVAAWPDGSPWMQAFLTDVGPAAITSHLAMWGTSGTMQLNPVMWSLVHEIRISPVIPLFAVLLALAPVAGVLGGAMLSVVCGVVIIKLHLADTGFFNGGETAGASWLVTGFFVFPFMVGALIAAQRTALTRTMRFRASFIYTIFAAGIVTVLWPLHGNSTYFLYSFGGLAIVSAVVVGEERFKLLGSRPLLWLGRVSYSLYLVHFTVLYALAHVAGVWSSPVLALFLFVPAALLSAAVFHRFVEQPAHSLGRRLARGPGRLRPAVELR